MLLLLLLHPSLGTPEVHVLRNHRVVHLPRWTLVTLVTGRQPENLQARVLADRPAKARQISKWNTAIFSIDNPNRTHYGIRLNQSCAAVEVSVRSSFSAAAICLSLVLASSSALTQTITASLHGRVSDKSGAVLPAATLTIVNVETGWSRSAQTDSSGECQLTLVPVGTYKVSAAQPGFQAETRTLQLTIGATASVEFSLSPGKVEQSVTVTADAPLVAQLQSPSADQGQCRTRTH